MNVKSPISDNEMQGDVIVSVLGCGQRREILPLLVYLFFRNFSTVRSDWIFWGFKGNAREDVRQRIEYQSSSSNLARHKVLRRLSSLPEKQFTRFLITHHKLIYSNGKIST